ncbi:hypothetical protein [Arthrobacter pityocampae]|nr:hypothetical protein [Arthrobacter pityocampae]
MTSEPNLEPYAWLPSQLESVALRLARADQLAYEMGDVIGEWSLDGPMTLLDIRRGASMRLEVESVRPVPPVASFLFSEAINHLRAALDNVIWHLVSKANPRLSPSAQRAVSMPIFDHDNREGFDKWAGRMKSAKITAFSSNARLGQAVRKLQPFEDGPSKVGSVSKRFAAVSGHDVELAHPLLLLQAYSNADKHRTVQIAAARSFVSDDRTPLGAQDRRHRPLRVGDVLLRGRVGEVVGVETQTAAMIRRPEPFTEWASPVQELNKLRQYLSEVAIPTLLTGLVLPSGLPPHIGLGDTGQTLRERIISGGAADAVRRLDEPTRERMRKAEARPIQRPRIVIEDEVQS